MSSEAADLYMFSSEGYGLDEVRACFRLRRLKGRDADDYLLIRIDPPILGQPYGLGARDIPLVVVAARHAGSTLFPVNAWPVSVHVARPLIGDIEGHEFIEAADIEEIGWAELYPDRKAAQRNTGAERDNPGSSGLAEHSGGGRVRHE